MNSSSIADVKASDRKGKSFIPSENRSANSDYTMIQNSKTYFEGSKDGMKGTSRWLIKPGLGDILDSTHSRTIQLVLLARNDTKLALIEQLKEQLDNIEFASIIDADKYTQLSVPVHTHTAISLRTRTHRLCTRAYSPHAQSRPPKANSQPILSLRLLSFFEICWDLSAKY